MKISPELLTKYGQTFQSQQTIFDEGDPAHDMFIILSGKVGIHKKINEAYRLLIELKDGDMFGEMAVVDKKNRSARAIAQTDVRLIAINEALMVQLIQSNPDFALKMVRVLSSRLRDTNETLATLLAGDRKNLVTSALVTYSNAYGEPVPGGKRIQLQQFFKWAILRVGLDLKDLNSSVSMLLQDKLVSRMENNPQDLIIKEEIQKYKIQS